MKNPQDLITKITHFLNEEMWRVRADHMSPKQFILIRIIRTLFLAVKGFIKDNCSQKASALSYYSLLSIVPVAALAFGIAKGFDFEERLYRQLEDKLEGQEEVVEVLVEFADNYLARTSGGSIAGIGLIILFWSVIQVFSNVEVSFNEIWKVKEQRSFIKKFTDFISLLFVGILFMASTSGIVMFATKQLKSIGFDYGIFLPVSSLLVTWVLFTLLLSIMPNVKVKTSSAFYGAAISGTLFLALQHGYIYFQHMLTSYNAVYGSFAALPFFMIWMQMSWLIVLLGSELSYAHQNARSFEFESEIKNVSYSYRRIILIWLVERIVKRFDDGIKAYNNVELSTELNLPSRLVNELLSELVECEILAEVVNDESDETFYQPALSVGRLTLMKVINTIDQRGTCDFHYEDSEELISIKKILDEVNDLVMSSDKNILIKNL